jgi:hypothetical protein
MGKVIDQPRFKGLTNVSAPSLPASAFIQTSL